MFAQEDLHAPPMWFLSMVRGNNRRLAANGQWKRLAGQQSFATTKTMRLQLSEDTISNGNKDENVRVYEIYPFSHSHLPCL